MGAKTPASSCGRRAPACQTPFQTWTPSSRRPRLTASRWLHSRAIVSCQFALAPRSQQHRNTGNCCSLHIACIHMLLGAIMNAVHLVLVAVICCVADALLLFALQQFETAAKEGRLEEVLAEGAIKMTPEEVQQLKARQAADGGAAHGADDMLGPKVPDAHTPAPEPPPASSRGATAAGAPPAQQQAEAAAAVGSNQAQPVQSAFAAAPDRSTAAGDIVDSPRSTPAADSSITTGQGGAQPADTCTARWRSQCSFCT